MSKSNNDKPTEKNPMLEGAMMAPPETMRNAESRADGFWDEDSPYPVYGTLLFAREVTPKKGPSAGKLRRYYVFELGAPTMLLANEDRNQPARAAKAGEIVAVWGTPGNSDLNRLAGCKVWMKKKRPEEFIDTGKGQPMKTYHMKYEGQGQPIRVLKFTEDADAPASHMGAAPVGPIPF